MFDLLFLNPYLVFVVGGILLYIGSELLIDHSVIIANYFNLSKVLIGSTIVALGTSLPEIVVSIMANLNGNSNIVIGNILGSNIANLSLVFGVLLLFKTIYFVNDKKNIFNLFYLLLLTIFFYFLLANGFISQLFGFILLLLFIIYVLISIRIANYDDIYTSDASIYNPIFSIIKILIGTVSIYFGSNLFIDGAIGISISLGISDLVIGMTIVALGTSVPELIVSINSIIKKQTDISIGNIVGSNIINIVFAIGLSSMIKEIQLSYNNLFFYNNYMLTITILIVLLILIFKKLDRFFGLLFISIYFVFIYLNFYINN